jgi:integrase
LSLGTASALAGLSGVTPHTLRHTAATWLMQNGVPIWEAAGFLGMSAEMLARVYGHHHPDHLRNAAGKVGSKSRDALVVSLEEAKNRRAENQKAQ